MTAAENDELFSEREELHPWKRNVALICTSHFLLNTSLYLLLMTLAFGYLSWWTDLLSAASVGVVLLSFVPGMCLVGPLGAYLVDRFKRKRVFVVSAWLYIAATYCYTVIHSIPAFAGLWFVQGAAVHLMTMSGGATMLIDVSPSGKRTRSSVRYARIGRIGVICGILSGAFLLNAVSLPTISYLVMGAGLLSLLCIRFVELPFRAPLNVSLLSTDRFFLSASLGPAAMASVFGAVLGVVAALHVDWLLYLYLMCGVVIAFGMRPLLTPYFRQRWSVQLGLVLVLLAFIMLAFMHHFLMFYVSAVILGIGLGMGTGQLYLDMMHIPLHCERGTSHQTYQLFWHTGILGGFVHQYAVSLHTPQIAYTHLFILLPAALILFQLLIQPHVFRQIGDRSRP